MGQNKFIACEVCRGRCGEIDRRNDVTPDFFRRHPGCCLNPSNKILREAIDLTKNETYAQLIKWVRSKRPGYDAEEYGLVKTIAMFIKNFADRMIGNLVTDFQVLRETVKKLFTSTVNTDRRDKMLNLITQIELA